VVRHEVTYLKPLMFEFRPVSIECWVTEIRAVTFTMGYEVFHDRPDGGRDVYLRASTVLTPYVFGQDRPRRITAEEREILTAHLEPEERARRRPERLPPGRVAHHVVNVRFSDVDVYGHVNNVKYFEYFQEARIALLAQVSADVGGYSIVVAQTDVDYLRPILFRPEPYECRSVIARLGTRSMTVESQILDGETLLARARVVVVFFDRATNRSAEPSPELRERLAAATDAIDGA
jgi:acyl-CoA thioester hydrolase